MGFFSNQKKAAAEATQHLDPVTTTATATATATTAPTTAAADDPIHLVHAVRDAPDSTTLTAALIALHEADKPELCTPDLCDLLLARSALVRDVVCASWYFSCFAWFARRDETRGIAAPRVRVRDTLFELAHEYATTADAVRCYSQACCNLCIATAGKQNFSTKEGHDVFLKLAKYATTNHAIKFLTMWINNASTIDEGRVNFGTVAVAKAFAKLSEMATDGDACQWLASMAANICMIDHPRDNFTIPETIDAVHNMAMHLTPTTTPEAARYILVFTNNISISDKGRELLSCKKFHDTIVRISKTCASNWTAHYISTTISNCTCVEGGKMTFATKEIMKVYRRVIDHVSEVATARYVCTSISNICSDEIGRKVFVGAPAPLSLLRAAEGGEEEATEGEKTDEIKSALTTSFDPVPATATATTATTATKAENVEKEDEEPIAPTLMVDVLTKAGRLIYTTRASKSTPKERRECARWFFSAVSNLSMTETGQKLFGGCPNFIDTWTVVASNTSDCLDASAGHYACTSLNNIAIDPESRKGFAKDSLVEAFVRGLSHAVNVVITPPIGGIVPLEADDEEEEELEDEFGDADPEMRAAIKASKETAAGGTPSDAGVHFFGSAVANLCIDDSCKKVFARQSMVDALIRVAAKATSSESARYLCTAVSNCCAASTTPGSTEDGQAGRDVFSTVDMVTDFFAVLAPIATSADSARWVTSAIANLTLTDANRKAFVEAGDCINLDILCVVAPYITTADSARYWCTAANNVNVEPTARRFFSNFGALDGGAAAAAQGIDAEVPIIQAYNLIVPYTTTKETAHFFFSSLHNACLLDDTRLAYAASGKMLKNVFLKAVMTPGAVVPEELEAATWWINCLDVLFTEVPTRAHFTTRSFYQAFMKVDAFMKRIVAEVPCRLTPVEIRSHDELMVRLTRCKQDVAFDVVEASGGENMSMLLDDTEEVLDQSNYAKHRPADIKRLSDNLKYEGF